MLVDENALDEYFMEYSTRYAGSAINFEELSKELNESFGIDSLAYGNWVKNTLTKTEWGPWQVGFHFGLWLAERLRNDS